MCVCQLALMLQPIRGRNSEIHCSIPAVEYFRIRTLGCRIACDAEAGVQHGGPGVSGRASHHQQGHHLREQLLPGHCTGRRTLLLRLFSPNRHCRGRCTAAAGIASPPMSLFIPDCQQFCDERAINNVLFTVPPCVESPCFLRMPGSRTSKLAAEA